METNTMTVELPTQLYKQLQNLADDEHTNLVEFLTRLVTVVTEQRTQAPVGNRAFQRIAERATDLGITDLAAQHDHYLYGTEKR